MKGRIDAFFYEKDVRHQQPAKREEQFHAIIAEPSSRAAAEVSSHHRPDRECTPSVEIGNPVFHQLSPRCGPATSHVPRRIASRDGQQCSRQFLLRACEKIHMALTKGWCADVDAADIAFVAQTVVRAARIQRSNT